MGSYTFPYIGTVGSKNQVTVANAFAWFVLLVTQTLLELDASNVAVIFGFFCVVTVAGLIYMGLRLKTTDGLSYD